MRSGPASASCAGREFIMKDAYSFDVDDAAADQRLLGHVQRLHPASSPGWG